jgi:hypothetical protein
MDAQPERDGDELRVPADPAAAGGAGGLVEAHPAADAIAARLTEGPVALAPARYPSLDKRMELIDAVAALLPAGVLLSASTWADRRSSHQIRLVYTQQTGADDLDPAQERSPDGLPPDSVAGRYATNLAAASTLLGGLTAVAAGLAADPTPRSFGQPEELVSAVAAPVVTRLVGEHESGGTDLAPVREALGLFVPPADPEGALLRLLLPAATDTDLPLLARHWVPAALPALADRCCALARERGPAADGWPEASGPELERLLTFAENRGVLPALTGRLLATGKETATGLGLDIVRQRELTGEDGERLRDQLAGDPELTVQLLVMQVARAGQGVGAPGRPARMLIRWLMEARDEATMVYLHTFWLATSEATGYQPPGVADLADLARLRVGEAAVGALLQLAERSGRDKALRPVLDAWLHSRDLTEEQRAYWSARTGGRRPAERGRHHHGRMGWLRSSGGQEPPTPEPAATDGHGQPLDGRRVEQGPPAPEPAATDGLVLTVTQVSARTAAAHYEPVKGEYAFFGDGYDSVAVVSQPPNMRASLCRATQFAEYAATGAGPGTFMHAVENTPLGSPLRLAARDIADVAGAIEAFGFGAVASVAATALEGPVSVVAEDLPDRRLRVLFLDAVAALLPHGTAISLAMCTGPAARGTPFHLDFRPGAGKVRPDATAQDSADRDFPDQDRSHRATLRWDALPHSSLRPAGIGRHYYDRLLLVRNGVRDTAAIVAALRADCEPLDLGSVTDRLSLPRSDRPVFDVSAPVGDQHAQAQAALAGRSVPAGESRMVLSALWGSGGIDDLELAHRYAAWLSARDPFSPVLQELARRQWPDAGVRDRVIASLATVVRNDPAAAGTGGLTFVPEPVLVQMVVQEVRAGENARWPGWLAELRRGDALPCELRPFRTIQAGDSVPAGQGPSGDPSGLAELAKHGADAVTALLQAARLVDPRDERGWLAWLLERFAETQPVAAQLRALAPAGSAGLRVG